MTPQDPTHRHAGHDELLVAAYAAGDLSGEQQAKAEALVASCADCRALVADLRSLVAAVRSLPSPARPRDFRITERQAAALRQRGLGRFVAGRRSWTGFARPLGTALATFGVAGLLLTASIGGLGLPGTAASAPAIGADYGAQAPGEAVNGRDSGSKAGTGGPLAPSPAARPAASGQIPSAAPVYAASPPVAVASPAASQGPAAPSAASAQSTGGRDSSAPGSPGPSGPPVVPSAAPSAAGLPSPASSAEPPEVLQSAQGGSTGAKPGIPGGPIIPVASLAAIVLGLGLLGAERLVRRR